MRRSVKPGMAMGPRMRRGRNKFEARETKDSRRSAKEAMRVALSQRRSSSWRFGGGRWDLRYVAT